ncbi:hypothetical protein BDY24DRAFT_377566, partial [Mrakia frigida]|uniref:uncharacterized protein n=1 Tax=Mrakia frigida TaxID=29902 RepID=UPI003FCC0F78
MFKEYALIDLKHYKSGKFLPSPFFSCWTDSESQPSQPTHQPNSTSISPMEGIKDTIQNVKDQFDAPADPSKTNTSTSLGDFPKPDDYDKTQTQKGRVVGIEADIPGQKPLVTEQEGNNGFEAYKAAGKLVGKKTIVTGGDSGIGRAAAVMFALEGADVAIVYLPEEEVDAQETKRLIEQAGQICLTIPQDIREEEGCKRVIDLVVREFGRIDVLVNNASVMYDVPDITEITTEQFDRTVKTNIYGTFFMTRAAVPHIPRGGSIITTASQVAYAG